MTFDEQRFRFPFEAIKKDSKIVIYGGGVVGKTFLQEINTTGYCSVIAVCDRNPQNTGITEVPVMTLEDFIKDNTDIYDSIVIAIEIESIAIEIFKKLLDSGIKKHKIKWINPQRNH